LGHEFFAWQIHLLEGWDSDYQPVTTVFHLVTKSLIRDEAALWNMARAKIPIDPA
jgi:hypothetical protein